MKKASVYGVSVADWLEALNVAGLGDCNSLGALLGVIHRAESAAAMLRAGYRPTRDAGGACPGRGRPHRSLRPGGNAWFPARLWVRLLALTRLRYGSP